MVVFYDAVACRAFLVHLCTDCAQGGIEAVHFRDGHCKAVCHLVALHQAFDLHGCHSIFTYVQTYDYSRHTDSLFLKITKRAPAGDDPSSAPDRTPEILILYITHLIIRSITA